jgi:pullulanase/glycogen debranching enzyme
MQPADKRYLGAGLTEEGCNFAIWAAAAESVELCLFDEVNGKMSRLATPSLIATDRSFMVT